MPTGKHEFVHAGVQLPGRPAADVPAEPLEPDEPPEPLEPDEPLEPPEPLALPALPAVPPSAVTSPGLGITTGGAHCVHSVAKYPPIFERPSALHWCTPSVPVDMHMQGSVAPILHSVPVEDGGAVIIPVEPALPAPTPARAALPPEPFGMV